MSTAFKYYKRRFKNSLEPLLVMLVAKKNELNGKRWNTLVLRTASSIVNNPTEYLGDNLPDYALSCDILHEIFEQFFKSKGDAKLDGFHAVANELSSAKRRHSQMSNISDNR